MFRSIFSHKPIRAHSNWVLWAGGGICNLKGIFCTCRMYHYRMGLPSSGPVICRQALRTGWCHWPAVRLTVEPMKDVIVLSAWRFHQFLCTVHNTLRIALLLLKLTCCIRTHATFLWTNTLVFGIPDDHTTLHSCSNQPSVWAGRYQG